MNIEPLNISPVFLLLLLLLFCSIFTAVAIIVNGYLTRKPILKKIEPIEIAVKSWITENKNEMEVIKFILEEHLDFDFEKERQKLEALTIKQKSLIKKEGKNE